MLLAGPWGAARRDQSTAAHANGAVRQGGAVLRPGRMTRPIDLCHLTSTIAFSSSFDQIAWLWLQAAAAPATGSAKEGRGPR